MQHPAKTPPPSPGFWPEVDRVRADSVIDLPAGPWVYPAVKPALDFALALLLAVPALPVVALCWALVRLTSRGPGFYSQTRSGLGGMPFQILKLRSMTHGVEGKTGIQWSQKGDSRVTRVGKFLRATHLDELPQLWNVLRGEMSLVGPRPERPEVIESKGLARQVPGYEYRLDVRPGVTGFAQVQLPPDSNVQSVRYKIAYDLYYIANQGFWFDLRLIAATLIKTIGLKPPALRRLFGLPPREDVATAFRAMTLPPATLPMPAHALQTA